jgi:hypothetical protein
LKEESQPDIQEIQLLEQQLKVIDATTSVALNKSVSTSTKVEKNLNPVEELEEWKSGSYNIDEVIYYFYNESY